MHIGMQKRRFAKVAAAAVAAVGLCALTVPLSSAQAQVPYLGVDFGNGFGIGIGAPPSAYGMAPASPLYPFYGSPYYYSPYHSPWR